MSKKGSIQRTPNAYEKHRRKKQRRTKDKYFRQQRSMRDTNEARMADGRETKGGGTYPAVMKMRIREPEGDDRSQVYADEWHAWMIPGGQETVEEPGVEDGTGEEPGGQEGTG